MSAREPVGPVMKFARDGRGSRVAVLASVVRHPGLARVSCAYFFFAVAEYGVWIAMLVYAFQRGGPATAGVVAVVQLVPGALLAPWIATAADRRSPATLLKAGYLVQGAGMAATAVVIHSGGPAPLAYAFATVASTAVTATRPAQWSLVPALAHDARQLTATNVVCGWLGSVGIVGASAGTGVALAQGRPGLVFAVGAALAVAAAVLVVTIQAAPLDVPDTADDAGRVGVPSLAGWRVLSREARPRALALLVTGQYVVVGALDVLFVVMAIDVLGRDPSWVGYLNTAYGLGAIGAGALTALLVGRALSVPILGAVAVSSAALALTAVSHQVVPTAVLLGLVGGSRAVLDIATRTLLQRVLPPELIGRVFGVVESLSMTAMAAGSLLTPLLIYLGGNAAAVVGVAVVLPLLTLLAGRVMWHLDDGTVVPVVEIALLRSLPQFAVLPAPALEGLAAALQRIDVPPGGVVVRQGEAGDRFFVIADGEVLVSVDGHHVRRQGRGEAFGEIALLHGIPRTATVTVDGPVTLYALDQRAFLDVVAAHDATRRATAGVARGRLADDAARR